MYPNISDTPIDISSFPNLSGVVDAIYNPIKTALVLEAEKRGIIHVDGLSLVPPIPSLFADEWLHPNALGFGFYSENLTRIILGHLK